MDGANGRSRGGLVPDVSSLLLLLCQLMGDIEGETIGIITLEDVLEELIGNEIEDECESFVSSSMRLGLFLVLTPPSLLPP